MSSPPKAAGSKSASPRSPKSPEAAASSPHDAAEIIEANDEEDNADSIAGADDVTLSTASVASSIMKYRTIQGRTFHSERHETNYFTPNDERQLESIDITHHYLGLMIDGKLHLAPTGDDIQKVLDVGTGSGIWAIDFADEHPNAEVIGTDLSPTQPAWVPPNCKFEIDDCNKPWTWAEDTFDLVNIRYLLGAIGDWNQLFAEAYKAIKPGGWVHSCECEPMFTSDDGTVNEKTAMGSLWNQIYVEGGQKLGQTFEVLTQDVQKKGIEAAGFQDVGVANFKLPCGGWPKDQKLAEIGRLSKLAMDNDIEGYTLLLWTQVMGWPETEHQVFLAQMRREMADRKVHGYVRVRFVWGRKPEATAA